MTFRRFASYSLALLLFLAAGLFLLLAIAAPEGVGPAELLPVLVLAGVGWALKRVGDR